MYHFFAEHENIHDSYIDIVGSDVNHIKNVLRFKEGDKLLISSGDNVDYECSIASMSDEYIRADILSKDEQGKAYNTESCRTRSIQCCSCSNEKKRCKTRCEES